MPADLCVAVFGSRTILKVHPLEDGVLSILSLDGQSRRLYFPFTLQSSILGFLFSCFRGIVRKKVELDSAAIYGELLSLTEADLSALKEQQVI